MIMKRKNYYQVHKNKSPKTPKKSPPSKKRLQIICDFFIAESKKLIYGRHEASHLMTAEEVQCFK